MGFVSDIITKLEIIFMKNINKYVSFAVMAFMLVFAVGVFTPTRVEAFEWGRLIDPMCFFACDDDPDVGQLVDPACVWACNNYEDDNYYVYIQPNPTVRLTANSTSVNYNGSSFLSWTSNDATSCSASGGVNGWAGSKSTGGNFNTGALTNTTTFYITCSNSTGSANDMVTVYVNMDNQNYNYNNNYIPPATYVSISADRTNIAYNESTVIRWYPTNATYCSGSGGSNGWAGARNTFSSTFNTGALTSTTTYTISCNNYNNSSDTRSITVFVGSLTQIQTINSLTATTVGATQISNTGARLNSLIASSGNNSSTNSWFEWGKTIKLGNKTTVSPIGTSQSVAHTDTISGLSPGTTYYFRAVAENSLWRNIGSILSFTTSGQKTVVVVKEPVTTTTITTAPKTSMVLITSSINRNQPIVPTIDNTRPHPGDEINYTVNYQNIGTGAITNLTLRVDLPYEVNYMFANGVTPTIFSNTLVFNLGTLGANGQGSVAIKAKVRENAISGTNLNFPATLSYVDPSGQPKSVSANVSAQVWTEPANVVTQTNDKEDASLEASVFGAGFLPTNLFGWILLVVLIFLLVLIGKYLFVSSQPLPFSKETINIEEHH